MNRSKNRTIEKVVHIVKKNKLKSDFAYWQSQPYEKRLAIVEQIRNEYQNGNQQRLQRVCRIIKRTQS